MVRCPRLGGPIKSGEHEGRFYCTNDDLFALDQLPPGSVVGLRAAIVEKCMQDVCTRPMERQIDRLIVDQRDR
jgi:hypothetical protein